MARIRVRPSLQVNKPGTLETLLQKGRSSAAYTDLRTKESSKWFQDAAKKVKTTDSEILRETPDRLKNRLAIGEMGFFLYDPKHKAKLPYYDSFPLIIKIEDYNDGFLGINLHYLPLPLRVKLLDALMGLASNKKYNETTRLKISYSILKSAAKFAPFKPCVKRYLNNHVRSRFVKINIDEYDIAAFLPVASWNKGNANQVYADSRKKI
jgi:hypothetical protein